MSEPIIIIGGCQAAVQAIDSLRNAGCQTAITLLTDEASYPYQRPPLSKQFLAGAIEADRLPFRTPDYYREQAVDVHLACRIAEIDPQQHIVRSQDGQRFPYHRILLAVGARVRRLSVPGAGLPGVHYLRTMQDSLAIRDELARAERVAVIGGGFIGLEVAAVAAKLGKSVTVIEMQDRLMPRVVAPVVSAFYQSYHESRGVRVLLNTQVREILGTDRVGAVLCADGARVDTDLVVIGIGVIPNTELARAAGLECRNGIVVDRQTRTSDPDIVAAGDCAEHFNPLLGRQLRLESVHNAIEQAKVAAATLAGNPADYAVIPWFWSDQYDLKLQMAGISEGFDQIAMRGHTGGGKFTVFYFHGDRLLAVDTVNRPADHMLSRKLLANHAVLTPAQAADPQFDLKSLVPA